MITRKEAAPFGLRDKIGYLFGDFGNDFTFILSSSFLLKFYTDVMHISAGVVGIVMMLARFVDAFTVQDLPPRENSSPGYSVCAHPWQ